MIPRAFDILVLLLVACLPAYASKLVPLDLHKLPPQSEFIVVGVVTAISDGDAQSDTVSVRVISPLKGKTDAKSFSLRLGNKGVKDFDLTLAVGDQGVFFLKAIEGGRAELTCPGSIAVMPMKGNFSVPGTEGNPQAPKLGAGVSVSSPVAAVDQKPPVALEAEVKIVGTQGFRSVTVSVWLVGVKESAVITDGLTVTRDGKKATLTVTLPETTDGKGRLVIPSADKLAVVHLQAGEVTHVHVPINALALDEVGRDAVAGKIELVVEYEVPGVVGERVEGRGWEGQRGCHGRESKSRFGKGLGYGRGSTVTVGGVASNGLSATCEAWLRAIDGIYARTNNVHFRCARSDANR